MSIIGLCLNYGCTMPQGKQGDRFRPFCTRCHAAEVYRRSLPPGVSSFKTNICANMDGRLGFVCNTLACLPDWGRYGVTDIDHIDGIPFHNVPENVQELCAICHRIKGQIHNDHNAHRIARKGILIAL